MFKNKVKLSRAQRILNHKGTSDEVKALYLKLGGKLVETKVETKVEKPKEVIKKVITKKNDTKSSKKSK